VGAIADYEKAIELDPEDAIAYNNLGIVEEKLGRKEKAQQNFNKADALAGYPPKKETADLPEIGTAKSKPAAANTSRPINTVPAKKMNFNHYFSTLTTLFTDSATRKEFTSYLKTLFGSKPTKNS
jgi:tetratricopeptide (TPR) repeat protein